MDSDTAFNSETFESESGIKVETEEEVSADGILFKKHYSDFIVVEKHGDNKYCGTWPSEDLKPFKALEEQPPQGRPEWLSEEDYQGLQRIKEDKKGEYTFIFKDGQSSKENRKMLHYYIRENFGNELTSMSQKDNIVVSYGKSHSTAFRSRDPWPQGLGKFLHFTLKKTDHETAHALNSLAFCIRVQPRNFNFAGSKDRRAITYQRVSFFKLRDSKFASAKERIDKQNIEVSEFSYEDQDIKMGCHTGNVFYIILRNADIDEDRFNEIKNYGCFNVFGPQRFGSVSGSTAKVGLLILKKQYKEAVEMLLDPNLCTHVQLKDLLIKYAATQDASLVKNLPPHMIKFIEVIIISGLNRFKDNADKYLGALLQLPRTTRSLYLHAYQSLIFNAFVEKYKESNPVSTCNPELDIPLPCDGITPEHSEVYDIYTELLAKDGLTFSSFTDHNSNFGIHLTHRRLLLKPKDMEFKRLEHENPDAPFIFYPPPEKEIDQGKGHKSVFIKFELAPGGYATVVLSALYGRNF